MFCLVKTQNINSCETNMGPIFIYGTYYGMVYYMGQHLKIQNSPVKYGMYGHLTYECRE